jgi:general secretion pathway protein F
MKIHFQAFDGTGNLIEGEVDAASVDEARELIWSRGATPFVVRPSQATDLLFRDIRIERRSRPVSEAQLARLTRDLAILLQAGIPLEASLRVASMSTEDQRTRRLALELLDGLLKGSSLADVMAATSGAFRIEYIRIIQAGELSGDLGGAMQELADLLDRQVQVRSRVRAAMTYPALLVGLAVVSLWVVLGLLIPAVTPIFLENGMKLPALIAFLDAMRQYAPWLLAAGGACVAALVAAIAVARRNPALRVALDRLYLRIPVIGPISGLREAARLTRTLATLIKAGVPLLQALEAVCPMVRSHDTRDRFERVVADVREGASLGGAISKSAALPVVARQMITVGEESGRLQEMLARTALIFERQEQTRTAQMLALLTPAVTILVAGMVAGIILSVMGAILSINELVLL